MDPSSLFAIDTRDDFNSHSSINEYLRNSVIRDISITGLQFWVLKEATSQLGKSDL